MKIQRYKILIDRFITVELPRYSKLLTIIPSVPYNYDKDGKSIAWLYAEVYPAVKTTEKVDLMVLGTHDEYGSENNEFNSLEFWEYWMTVWQQLETISTVWHFYRRNKAR